MSAVYKFDIAMNCGAEYVQGFIWNQDGVAVDLTQYHAVSQIRDRSNVVVLDLLPYISLNAGGTLGRILIEVPASITADMTPEPGWKWDLLLILTADSDSAVRLIGGVARADAAVSR